jgi:hypothetical protein
MTQDEIIELARQAGLGFLDEPNWMFQDKLEAFAKLVADKRVEGMVVMTPDEFKSVWDKAQAEEREACAKICDEFFKGNKNINYSDTIAICIRARDYQKGQTD